MNVLMFLILICWFPTAGDCGFMMAFQPLASNLAWEGEIGAVFGGIGEDGVRKKAKSKDT